MSVKLIQFITICHSHLHNISSSISVTFYFINVNKHYLSVVRFSMFFQQMLTNADFKPFIKDIIVTLL